MTNEHVAFSMLFVGIGIGSLNPAGGSILGWIIPITIGFTFYYLGERYK